MSYEGGQGPEGAVGHIWIDGYLSVCLSICPPVYLYGTTCTGWSSVKSYTGWFLLRSVEKIIGYILTKIMDN